MEARGTYTAGPRSCCYWTKCRPVATAECWTRVRDYAVLFKAFLLDGRSGCLCSHPLPLIRPGKEPIAGSQGPEGSGRQTGVDTLMWLCVCEGLLGVKERERGQRSRLQGVFQNPADHRTHSSVSVSPPVSDPPVSDLKASGFQIRRTPLASHQKGKRTERPSAAAPCSHSKTPPLQVQTILQTPPHNTMLRLLSTCSRKPTGESRSTGHLTEDPRSRLPQERMAHLRHENCNDWLSGTLARPSASWMMVRAPNRLPLSPSFDVCLQEHLNGASRHE